MYCFLTWKNNRSNFFLAGKSVVCCCFFRRESDLDLSGFPSPQRGSRGRQRTITILCRHDPRSEKHGVVLDRIYKDMLLSKLNSFAHISTVDMPAKIQQLQAHQGEETRRCLCVVVVVVCCSNGSPRPASAPTVPHIAAGRASDRPIWSQLHRFPTIFDVIHLICILMARCVCVYSTLQ